jgi:hypothetical protein
MPLELPVDYRVQRFDESDELTVAGSAIEAW